MLFGIQPEEIDHVWPLVVPLLQRAVERSQNDYALADILGLLRSKAFQLWVWDAGSGIEACAITTITNYPRRRICQIPFLAGSKMRDWLTVEAVLREWARDKGCSQLEGYCRDGWLRVLKNWRKVWSTMRSDI